VLNASVALFYGSELPLHRLYDQAAFSCRFDAVCADDVAPFRMARVSAVIVALSLSVVGGALLPSFWIAFPSKGFA